MSPPIVLFDYGVSPYGKKVRLALSAAGLEFKQCEQPMVLPRPDLTALGITHRRIPILAIGKDVYCDSSSAINALQALSTQLRSSPSDKAYESYGNTIISTMLRTFPANFIPGLAEDRATLFPVLTRTDYSTLRQSGLSELKSLFEILESEMLSGNKYINGDVMTIADINTVFAVRWALLDLQYGQIPGFASSDLPRTYAWISRISLPEVNQIGAEEASALILQSEAEFAKLDVQENDLNDIPAGTGIVVETSDAAPGAHPQFGTLLGFTKYEVVVRIENGLRLHFPKRGYIIRSEAVVKSSA